MNTGVVWTALRRLWEPPRLAPVRPANDTVIQGELAVRRVLQRLRRSAGTLSLQSEDGAFDRSALLVDEVEATLTLRLMPLPPGSSAAPQQDVPRLLNVSACCDAGVVTFSLQLMPQRDGDLWEAPLPRQIMVVQSRRHYRVAGLNGVQFQARLVLPGEPGLLRLRNLSEEGLAFERAGPGVASGTLYHSASLQLDGMAVVVPELKVVYCRVHSECQCTVGAHFERIGAEDSRFLRRWIAAAQAAMASMHLDD